MKITKIFYSLLILKMISSCKDSSRVVINTEEKNEIDTIVTKSEKDIYIGKEFYSGDELVDVITIKNVKTDI